MNNTLLDYNDDTYKVYYPVNNNSAVVKSLLKNKIWEKKLIPYFEQYIDKDSVVIDIGAYIGSHTILMSKMAHKVYSFEPQKLAGKCLMKTIEENNLNNVKFYNIGLFNYKGINHIQTNNDGDASMVVPRKTPFKLEYPVQVDRLDNLVKDPIDFMKIDCEGAEFEVLEGAKNIIHIYKPVICIEVFKHSRWKIKQFCWKNDYNYKHISGDDFILTSK